MRIYVDGNPNEVCCVSDGKIAQYLVERALLDGTNTNNVAEYRAILFGLYKHPEATEVCSDSQLVVKQLNGEYAVKSEHLKKLCEKVLRRAVELRSGVKFTWVKRDDNPAGKVLG